MNEYRISLLPENDRTNGWGACLPPRTPRPHLPGDVRAEWLVIGAGWAGLAAGRLLPERGRGGEGHDRGDPRRRSRMRSEQSAARGYRGAGQALAASADTGARARRAGASGVGALALAVRGMSVRSRNRPPPARLAARWTMSRISASPARRSPEPMTTVRDQHDRNCDADDGLELRAQALRRHRAGTNHRQVRVRSSVRSSRVSRRCPFPARAAESDVTAGSSPFRPRPPSMWPYRPRPCRPLGHALPRPCPRVRRAAPARGPVLPAARTRHRRRSGS